jgi:hypothetical protein
MGANSAHQQLERALGLIPEFTSVEHHGAVIHREVREIREQILLPELPDLPVESSTQASSALENTAPPGSGGTGLVKDF